MTTRGKAALLSLLMPAVFAPLALAAGGPSLPKPEDPSIVPGISLGGVSVGQPIAEAEAAWGNRGACTEEKGARLCEYGNFKRGNATLSAIDGELANASLMAPRRGDEWRFRGPLMEFGTERGDLGLGDKLVKIAKRYPEAEMKGSRVLMVEEEGGRGMYFFAGYVKRGPATRRVTQIGIGTDPRR